MRMGNYLWPGFRNTGMATSERDAARPTVGIAHATVVPENFEPERGSEEDGNEDRTEE